MSEMEVKDNIKFIKNFKILITNLNKKTFKTIKCDSILFSNHTDKYNLTDCLYLLNNNKMIDVYNFTNEKFNIFSNTANDFDIIITQSPEEIIKISFKGLKNDNIKFFMFKYKNYLRNKDYEYRKNDGYVDCYDD